MDKPNHYSKPDGKETPPLEAQVLDPTTVMITEHNAQKRGNKDLFGDTSDRVRIAVEYCITDEIPPIVVLQNPFTSAEEAIKAYQKYTKLCPRAGGQYHENEDDILNEILRQDPLLLCYNGNRRLEEFQRAKIPIKAFVIKSKGEFTHIPQEEKRVTKKLENKRAIQYEIDRNYILSFLQLLDDIVYITAQNRYYDTLDTRELVIKMQERRRGGGRR